MFTNFDNISRFVLGFLVGIGYSAFIELANFICLYIKEHRIKIEHK